MASKVRWRSVRNAFSSCHVGTSAFLCRDCSHKDSVSLGSLEAHMYTKRQSQFSVRVPDISKAVRQPWRVRWSSRIADPDSWLKDCTLKSIFSCLFTNNRLFWKRSVRLAQAEQKPSKAKLETIVCASPLVFALRWNSYSTGDSLWLFI